MQRSKNSIFWKNTDIHKTRIKSPHLWVHKFLTAFILSLFLASAGMAQGTCTITGPTGGAEEDLHLDGTGVANINYNWLNNAAGIVINGCPLAGRRYRVYQGATFVTTLNRGAGGGSIVYNCTTGSQGVGTYSYNVYADNDNDASNGQIGPITLKVHVKDTDPPIINALASASFSGMTSNDNPGYNCTTTIAGLTHPTVNDNCASPTLTVQYFNGSTAINPQTQVNAGDPNMFPFPVGTTTAKYNAKDASGNVSTEYSFTVTVTDDEVPTWTDPMANLTANLSSDADIQKNGVNGIGRRNLHVLLDCQAEKFAEDLAYLNATFLPTATDNCASPVSVSLIAPPADNPYNCDVVDTYTNVKRRIIRRFQGNDGNGNILSNVPPDSRFVLKIYVVDNTHPLYVDDMAPLDSLPSAVTAVSVTAGIKEFTGAPVTVYTNETYNSTNIDSCRVDLSLGYQSIVGVPQECTEGSGLTPTLSWEITASSSITGALPFGMPGNDATGIYPVGTHTIEYTAVDNCGLTSTFTFDLVVVDNSPPIPVAGMDCPADITVNNDPGFCNADVQWTNPEYMDCSGTVTFSAVGIHSSGAAILIDLNAGPTVGGTLAEGEFPIGETTVTYTFTDAAIPAISTTCSFIVTVDDNQAPSVTGCGPVTINSICPDTEIPDYTGSVNIIDNCSGAYVTQTPAPGTKLSTLFPGGAVDGSTYNIILTPNDSTSAGPSCTIVATFLDLNQPIPTIPTLPNISNSNTLGADCGSFDYPAPTAQDCNGNTIYGIPSNFTNNLAGPNIYTFEKGGFGITWTYNYGSGLSVTQTQLITISDDAINPTVNAGPDRPVDTDPGVCTKTMSIDMTQIFPTVAPYLAVVDQPGNSQYIDNCGATITYTLSGATIMSVPTMVSPTPVVFELGVTTVTYTATDASGNAGTDVMTVTVSDNESPILSPTCWSTNLLIGTTSGDVTPMDCGFTLGNSDTSLDPTPTDNCPGPPPVIPVAPTKTITSIITTYGTAFIPGPNYPNSLAGSTFNADPTEHKETYFITWSISDANSNTVSCVQEIYVEDNEPPLLTCSSFSRGVGEDGNDLDCNYTVQGTEFDPPSSDYCSLVTLVNNLTGTNSLAGWNFSLSGSPHSVTWTSTDILGNVNSCTSVITVTDDVAPTLSCLGGSIFALPPSNTLTINPMVLVNNFTGDACSGFPTLSMSKTTFDCSDATNTPIPVIITATDASGNMSTCNTTVTIQENVLPNPVCKNITVQLGSTGHASISADQLNNGSTDNCTIPGSLSFSASQTSFDCNNLGPNQVTLTVTDLSDNSASCTATVTVEDNINPNAVCIPVIAELNAAGIVTVNASDFDNGSNDNTDACTGLTYMISGTALGTPTSSMAFDCSDVGETDVYLTVTDGQGRTDQCMTTVTILDQILPTTICKDITVNLGSNGEITIPASDLDNGSSDNCDPSGTSLTFTIDGNPNKTFDCFDIGVNTITLEVTDNNGQTATCTSNVTVLPHETVALKIGNVSGGAGQIVDIPITISAGEDLRSLGFTIEILDPTVAVIDGYTSVFAASEVNDNFIGNNKLAFAWNASNITPSNFADGTTIATLQVELLGADNDMSDIIFVAGANPTELLASQGCGVPYTTNVNGTDGSILIAPNTTVTIGGAIYSEEGERLPGVEVTMSGDEDDVVFTDANGDYEFTIPVGSSVVLTPSSDTTPIKGVDVGDLAILINHFVTGNGITSPYDLIGGNVLPDGAPGIQIFDVARIRQEIVNPNPTFQPLSNSFKFVSSDYVFTSPMAPWLEAFEQERTLTNMTSSNSSLDFISVKMGDVNSSWNPLAPISSNSSGPTTLVMEDISLNEGETGTVRFRTEAFIDLVGFQSTFNFDHSAFEIVSANPINLENFTQEMISLEYADQGLFTIIWYNAFAVSVKEQKQIIELTIKAKEDISSLDGLIEFTDEIAEPMVYAKQMIRGDFDFEIEGLTTSIGIVNSNELELFQNIPNPFINTTTLSFNLPKSTFAKISISDATGRVIWRRDGHFPQGMNQLTVDADELPQTGVLISRLEVEGNSKIRKMILLRK